MENQKAENKEPKRFITKHQEEVYRCRHHDFENLSAKETAKKLGIAVTTVYEVMARLKKIAPQLFPTLLSKSAEAWGLWYVSGLSCEQVAERMGTTIKSVYDRLERIKKKFGYTNIIIESIYRPLSLDRDMDIDRIEIIHKF